MRPQICCAVLAISIASFLKMAPAWADSDSCWPPLNGTSQIIEEPVRVGDYVFGSGSYSYFVGRYSVPSLHCEKSINSGPREWYLMVESGRVVVKGEPEGTKHGPLPPASPSLPPLAALPAMSSSSLPPMSSMPNLQSLPAIEKLPPLSQNSLAPLPATSPLKALPPLR